VDSREGGRDPATSKAKQKESMFLSRYFIDIHSACERGDLEEVKRYLKKGGDIEKKKVNPLEPLVPHPTPSLSPDLLSSLSGWRYSSDRGLSLWSY
jgi:hypothetical protein